MCGVASLFLVQCLLVPLVASECAGEACLSTPDPAVLLQLPVSIKASVVESADLKTTVGCADLTVKGEQVCDMSEGCNWDPTDGVCAAGCETFDKPGGSISDTEAACPKHYCFFTLKWTGSKAVGRCTSTTWMRFGGKASKHTETTDGLNKKEVPQFVTTTHCVGDCGNVGSWDTCAPHSPVGCEPSQSDIAWATTACKDDCFYGSHGWDGVLRADLRGDVQVVAAEVNIKCEHKGHLTVAWGRNAKAALGTSKWANLVRNSKIRMWYNDQLICGHSGGFCPPHGERSIAISSTDDVPIFRVEMSRNNKLYKATNMFTVTATDVKASFDKCMELKALHGECLQVFGGNSGRKSELRSSHALQAQCLCSDAGSRSEGGAPFQQWCRDLAHKGVVTYRGNNHISDCAPWLRCLHSDAKSMILKTVFSTSLLESTSTALLTQDLTKTTLKCSANPAGSGPGFCVDPANLDVEAFDCNCFDFMNHNSPGDIRARFCADERVCCDWKTRQHCPPSLVEVNESSMMQRSQLEKTSEDDVSLDESLSGKRGCSE